MSEQEVNEQEVREEAVSDQEVSEQEVREQEVREQEVGGLETPANTEAPTNLEAPIIAVLHTCFDPEIPVDIYELGLIYGIRGSNHGNSKCKRVSVEATCGGLVIELS